MKSISEHLTSRSHTGLTDGPSEHSVPAPACQYPISSLEGQRYTARRALSPEGYQLRLVPTDRRRANSSFSRHSKTLDISVQGGFGCQQLEPELLQ